jgi:hypothetical protein
VHRWLLLPGCGHLLLPVRPLLNNKMFKLATSYHNGAVVHSPYALMYVGSGTALNDRSESFRETCIEREIHREVVFCRCIVVSR